MTRESKMIWTGRVLSFIPILMFCVGGTAALIMPEQMREGVGKLGYPMDELKWIASLEIVFGLIYAIPQTSILGAILLTAYLGGATASHIRLHDPNAVVPVVFGIVVWLGIFLREPRLRTILPWRS